MVVVLILVAQIGIARSTNNTEEHKYEVIKDYGDFEIRKYEPAIFSYTVMDEKSYNDVSSKGFRILAGYIFGNNESNQKNCHDHSCWHGYGRFHNYEVYGTIWI